MPRKSKRNSLSDHRQRQVPFCGDDAALGSAGGDRSNSCNESVTSVGNQNEVLMKRTQELEEELASLRQQFARFSAMDCVAKASNCEDLLPVNARATGPSKADLPDSNKESALMPRGDLPKVELFPFEGRPEEYWKFIRQFDIYVESKVCDSGQRLLYLLHYCRGNARRAIDACIMLPPIVGYERARSILKELYGLPHVVARSLLDELLREAKKVRDSAESLGNLALRMESCSITLGQMKYESDLNNMGTLEAIVRHLPPALQSKWSEIADQITVSCREVDFSDLMRFISDRARIARSRFGQIMQCGSSRAPHVSNPPGRLHVNNYFGSVNAGESRDYCQLCRVDHRYEVCPVFLKSTVKQRWNIARRLQLCYMCLGRFHQSSNCKTAAKCNVKDCQGKHHALLHQQLQRADSISHVKCNATAWEGSVHLGTLPVKIYTPSGVVSATALLDNGSDSSFISGTFAKQNNLTGTPSEITISTLNDRHRISSNRVYFALSSVDGGELVEVTEAYTIDALPAVAKLPGDLRQRYSHLRDVHIPEVEDANATVIIGCNVPEAHWVLDQRVGGKKEPFATKTMLGWVLHGPTSSKDALSVRCTHSDTPSILQMLEGLYNSEFKDLSFDGVSLSREDKKALEMVSTTHLMNSHYVVPLPWKIKGCRIPNNLCVAQRRLSYLRRRFERDPDLFTRYSAVMQHHMDSGHIEEKSDSTDDATSNKWYLPHHPVLNAKKPGKLRVVFDCAARYCERSLNDYLMSGPNMTNSLVNILLRFRLHQFAVAADVEEMFLQVGVHESDRNCLRLLWWPNNDLNAEVKTYRMTVHPFGATSSPFCATYALRKTVTDFGYLFTKNIGQYVNDNFYVDDCLLSVQTIEEAKTAVTGLRELLLKGGFRLTKWFSNNIEILDDISLADRAAGFRMISDILPTERTLGLRWDTNTDEFAFSFLLPDRLSCKRGLLSAIAGVYDPLGFIAPWLLPGKHLLQETCRQRLSWDDQLPVELDKAICNWLNCLKRLGELRIPRCLVHQDEVNAKLELHVFTDASDVGYAAVAYLRLVNGTKTYSVRLLMAKSRVNPLKTVSIPRLELSAAVLGVKLFTTVKDCFGDHVNDIMFWTDSSIVLHYIRNVSSRFATFVANRLTYIHDHSCCAQWRYVKSGYNPADIASRGTTDPKALSEWISGPGFLLQSTEDWPNMQPAEVRGEQVELKNVRCNVAVVCGTNPINDLLKRSSSWMKVLKLTAWLIRFKRYMEVMYGKRTDRSIDIGPLKVGELKQAEQDIIRLMQKEAFHDELTHLSTTPCKKGKLRKLSPFLQDGIIKIGGRVRNMQKVDVMHPIILPKDHWATSLIILHYHVFEGHAGPVHVLSEVRRKFWVLNGLSTVKRAINNCTLSAR